MHVLTLLNSEQASFYFAQILCSRARHLYVYISIYIYIINNNYKNIIIRPRRPRSPSASRGRTPQSTPEGILLSLLLSLSLLLLLVVVVVVVVLLSLLLLVVVVLLWREPNILVCLLSHAEVAQS